MGANRGVLPRKDRSDGCSVKISLNGQVGYGPYRVTTFDTEIVRPPVGARLSLSIHRKKAGTRTCLGFGRNQKRGQYGQPCGNLA
jgi:hypothetical protein